MLAGADKGVFQDRELGRGGAVHHFLSNSHVADERIDEFRNISRWCQWTQTEKDADGVTLPPRKRGVFPQNIHMAGMSRPFFEECEKLGVPVVVLVAFCGEGYNVPDGVELANAIAEVPSLHLKTLNNKTSRTSAQFPVSWDSLSPNNPVLPEPSPFY